jgi:hypothetical protein
MGRSMAVPTRFLRSKAGPQSAQSAAGKCTSPARGKVMGEMRLRAKTGGRPEASSRRIGFLNPQPAVYERSTAPLKH